MEYGNHLGLEEIMLERKKTCTKLKLPGHLVSKIKHVLDQQDFRMTNKFYTLETTFIRLGGFGFSKL